METRVRLTLEKSNLCDFNTSVNHNECYDVNPLTSNWRLFLFEVNVLTPTLLWEKRREYYRRPTDAYLNGIRTDAQTKLSFVQLSQASPGNICEYAKV